MYRIYKPNYVHLTQIEPQEMSEIKALVSIWEWTKEKIEAG